jgi:putative heme-binding domain-containing protein
MAALEVLRGFDDPEISTSLLPRHESLKLLVRSRLREVLLSRRSSALALLSEIDAGKIPAEQVPVEQLQPVALFNDRQLNDLVQKNWGKLSGGTPGEKLAEIRRLNNDVRAASGDPVRGHELYKKTCAACHKLFDEGGAIGPDLTHANRHDRAFLLTSIVDPSAVVRKEFLNYVTETTDGRFLAGLIAEQTPGSVTLLAINNERIVLQRDKIKSLQELPVSLMPEGLLLALKPQELRDLFSYLQKDKP